MKLAPHLTKPHECLTFWDYVRQWLRKWLGRLLFAGFWMVMGWAARYTVEASDCPRFWQSVGVAAVLMLGVLIVILRLGLGLVRAMRGG